MSQQFSMLQHQRGFSLVEIMIAMTLGLILMLGLTSLLTGNSATYRLTDGIGKVQENARFLQNSLSKDLRMIGFRGCMTRENITVTNTLNLATSLAYNFTDAGITGYNNIPAILPAELNTYLTGDPTPLTGSDLLLIRGPRGDDVAVVANNNSSQLFAAQAASTAFVIGDIIMVSDCEKARIFQITNIAANAANRIDIVHGNNTNRQVTPGNATHNWGPPNTDETFGTSALLVAYQTTAFYLGKNPANGQPALYRKINGQAATPLVDGVYALQIRYGEDTNSDSQVDAYRDAASVSSWNNVISINVEMVLGSNETGLVAKPQTLAFNQTTFQATDTRWYMTKQVVSTLRNRIN